MAYTITLTDGTNSIDLYDGSDSKVREGGMAMPSPPIDSVYVDNPLYDGGRLARSRFRNRTISMTIKIIGSSLSDLQTNIRTIHRLLNDARERVLLGHGATVYLEYQWGESGGASVYFDVLDGELVLPDDYLSTILNKSYTIINARINLICKPFGRYTNQDESQATIENTQEPYEIETYYLTSDNTGDNLNAANDWAAQTFTPASTYTAVAGAFQIVVAGSPGDATIEIYATTGTPPEPTGSAIATGTTNVNGYPEDNAYRSYVLVEFDTPVALTDGVVYALVIRGAFDDTNYIIVFYDDADASYAGGTRWFTIDGGSDWTQDADDDFAFAVFSGQVDYNYQDITTTASYGDVPAKMYHKIDLNGATSTEKMWIAKRSGTRQTDDLWIEGEKYSSFTNKVGGAHVVNGVTLPDVSLSGGLYVQTWIVPTGGNIAANTEVGSVNYTISTVPVGQFRVLIRCKVQSEDAGDSAHLSFGLGWSYGDKTKAPAEASGEYYQCAANNIYEILDLGELNLPPIAESDIASNDSFELSIYQYATELLTQNEYYKMDIDYIFLLPIDEGVVIIDDVDLADLIAIDGITDPPNVFIMSSASEIEDYPDYTGAPFDLGREDTRIYILRDDTKVVTFTSDIKYQPLFLII